MPFSFTPKRKWSLDDVCFPLCLVLKKKGVGRGEDILTDEEREKEGRKEERKGMRAGQREGGRKKGGRRKEGGGGKEGNKERERQGK